MSGIQYPTRCRIIDPSGMTLAPGVVAVAPKKSMPHVGQCGTAELHDLGVKITLDNGDVIYGYECWWEPIDESEACHDE